MPIDHAARVMRVITWNRPGSAGNGKDDNFGEDNETHAIVLDKLMAWEKKLYDEVKVLFVTFLCFHFHGNSF